ncbi:uncharacterized protein Dana_GF27124, partial [Drosophila ananassae]
AYKKATSAGGGGGPPAQLGAAVEAKETEEETGEKGGGPNTGAGKGQRKVGRGNDQRRGPSMEGGGSSRACRNAPKSGAPQMPAEQGHPAGPVGQEGGGATGVAKPEVAAGAATHPAPAGAEGKEEEQEPWARGPWVWPAPTDRP